MPSIVTVTLILADRLMAIVSDMKYFGSYLKYKFFISVNFNCVLEIGVYENLFMDASA